MDVVGSIPFSLVCDAPVVGAGHLLPVEGEGDCRGASGAKGRMQPVAGCWGLKLLWEMLARLDVLQAQSSGSPRGGVATLALYLPVWGLP